MTAKELVEQFFMKGYVEQDYEFLLRSVSENYVDHSPAGARSNIDAVNILKIVAEQFSDLRITVLDIFAEHDLVATRVRYEGIHTGLCMGIPPTGKRICFEALENFRVSNGKIVESWGYWPDREIEKKLLT